MQIQKIAILGISGAGKSYASRKVADITKLPLFHMDALFWKGSWEAIPEPEYLKEHDKLISQKLWIIEGYIDKKMNKRAEEADLVLYLDYPGWFCAWRVFKRWLLHRKQSRPELPSEARERLKPSFIWMVFKGGEKEDIEAALQDIPSDKIKKFYSPRQFESYLTRFPHSM